MSMTCTICKKLEPDTTFYRCTLYEKTVFNPTMAGCHVGNLNNAAVMTGVLADGQTPEDLYLSSAD